MKVSGEEEFKRVIPQDLFKHQYLGKNLKIFLTERLIPKLFVGPHMASENVF